MNMITITSTSGKQTPFSVDVSAQHIVEDPNTLAILFGKFAKMIFPDTDEVRVYPKGSGVYFNDHHYGPVKDQTFDVGSVH